MVNDFNALERELKTQFVTNFCCITLGILKPSNQTKHRTKLKNVIDLKFVSVESQKISVIGDPK